MATRKEVREFLRRFQTKVREDGLYLVGRKKNLDYLAFLNIPWFVAREIVLALSEDKYVAGPLQDQDGSEGEVWLFAAEVEKSTVYIKLKLDCHAAKCLSFHPAERQMKPPFEQNGP
jgi:hypothetical protein